MTVSPMETQELGCSVEASLKGKMEEAMLPHYEGSKKLEGAKTPQYMVTLAATLLAFSAGTVIGWSAPALPMLEDINSSLPIHTTPDESSWIGSLLAIGAFIGALPSATLAAMLGRKNFMLLLAVPLEISWILIFYATTPQMIYAARLIAGVATGAVFTIVPMYISEIAENSVRGILCSAFSLILGGGVLFMYSIGAVASYYNMVLACMITPIVFVVGFFRAPETPVHLLTNGHRSQAEASLKKLRGPNYDTAMEIHELVTEMNQQSTTSASFFEVMGRREAKLALFISQGLMFFQQLSGINIVIFYSSKIFESAGATLKPEVCTILVGFAPLVATLVSMVLIDKAGRKILLQASAVVMAISLAVLGYYFMKKDRGDDVSSMGMVPVVAVISYIFLFSVGFGPIPWMMSGEVLPAEIKGVCTGIATSVNWFLAFLVTFAFKTLTDNLGNAGTYFLISFICVIAFLFSTFVVIETKGKSLQEIQNELAGRKTPLKDIPV